MSYESNYLDLLSHVLLSLEERRGSEIKVESYLTPRRGEYERDRCMCAHFRFVYYEVSLQNNGRTLMILGDDGLFEIDMNSIDSLEIQEDTIHITAEVGKMWRHDVLRLNHRGRRRVRDLPN